MAENTGTERKREGIIFVISGPSGSGKGTVMGHLKQLYPEAGLAVSATTRPMRDNEAEGREYFFKTREEFERLVAEGEILEHTLYNGNLYGTLKSEAERILGEGSDLLLEIEVDGAGQIKRLFGDRAVSIMLIAPSGEEQARRLRERKTDSEESIAARVARAYEEIRQAPSYDYVTVNETGLAEKCAEGILEIIRAEHRKSRRMASYIHDYFPDDDI